MKIVIATTTLYDKTSPFNHLFKDILNGFLDAGHSIIRVVATENEKDRSYDLEIDSQKITYIPVIRKLSVRANIIKRYLADTLTAMRMAKLIKKQGSADVLFEDACYSSYWTVSAAKKRGMRIVLMIQDVWPDNAVQAGLIKEKSLLYRCFEFFQKKVYKKVDKFVCISEDMKSFLESKNIPADRIEVIYNWGYGDEQVEIAWNDNLFVKKYNLSSEKKYVVYAGNIGRMQNVDLVVKAAKRLSFRDDIQFLIVGDGVMRSEIEQQVMNVDNITMLPFQPKELAPHIYSMANVNLAPIVSGGLKTALPSKIGICLSCGNPLIVCANHGTKLESMFEEFGCGAVVDTQNIDELIGKIIYFCDQKTTKNYECFKANFCRRENVLKYIKALQDGDM